MTSQLLIREQNTRNMRLEIVENTTGVSPLAFQANEEGITVPKLGSEDIVSFAHEAVTQGFDLGGFEFLGRSGEILTSHENETYSTFLCGVLHTTGSPADALDLFEVTHEGVRVAAVSLFDSEANMFRIRRLGVFEADNQASAVLQVQRIWNELRFQ